HNTLAATVVSMARLHEEPAVVLSGGCFQNRRLTERVVTALRRAGFRPYWHQRIPPNDGGIALGQIAAFLRNQESVQCVSPSRVESSALRPAIPCFAAAGSTS